MTAGQPTKYREEYCDLAIKFAKQGCTHVQIASKLGIAERTLYDWKSAHTEFLHALTYAKTISKANLIENAIEHLDDRNYNTNLLKLILSNCYKDESRINELKATSTIDKIQEVFKQYEDGKITIETAERASKLLSLQLDEETRKVMNILHQAEIDKKKGK